MRLCSTFIISIALSAQILLLSSLDPKKVSSGSSSDAPARSGHLTQDVAVLSSADDAICCVTALPRDPARSTEKRRFAYSICVVYFRKPLNTQKIGSHRNGHPVI